MKIAFLCKRQYMSKDVILDKYARLYEIPNQLSLLGHDVQCFCLSYQNHESGIWNESTDSKKIIWNSKSFKGIKKIGLLSYPFYLFKQLKEFQPDVVIGASDIPHIVIAEWCAKKLRKPFVADLYDNFEAYSQAKIPFFKLLFKRALSHAKMISTTSISLAEKIRLQHPEVPDVFPMPSTINQDVFIMGNKPRAREILGLPLKAKLIGTAGGLTHMKGISDLFRAWDALKTKHDDIYLVLAGPTEANTPLPNDKNVIYLGLLPHQDVATLFQALDVGVICIPDDNFGKYCFPQKAYEMLSANLCVVASAVGDVTHMFSSHSLYNSGNTNELIDRLEQQILRSQFNDIDILDWKATIEKFNERMNNISIS